LPVAYSELKRIFCPEPFTLGMALAKILSLVGYL